MNRCRHCGAKLSRLDKDICPFCGEKDPFEGNEVYQTEDLTKALEKVEVEEVKQKSRCAALVLAFLLGFIGVNEFYLGYKKAGFIVVIITLVFSIALTLLRLLVIQNNLIIIIPVIVYELLFIIQGISYFRSNAKDKRGELLK